MPWALVTGGSKRLGARICHHLARKGYDILIHYRSSATEAQQLAKMCRECGVEADCIQGDFSNESNIHDFLDDLHQQFPEIEHLINNVGHYYINSALATPMGKWRELYQTNFFAPLQLITGLLPSIKAHHGSIINIGTAGINLIKADTKYAAYANTKTALLLLTKSLARELAPDRVRVNMVSPGELEISQSLPEDLGKLPMHRAGKTEEVARAVAFLLDRENDYITGQNLEVAGALGL